jgi:antitoxin (DNA-binding transcriptional repressor) of toxin-antitoxin stability system
MEIPVSDAKARPTDLVLRRAEAGEEVVPTRHGPAAVRPTPCPLRYAGDHFSKTDLPSAL